MTAPDSLIVKAQRELETLKADLAGMTTNRNALREDVEALRDALTLIASPNRATYDKNGHDAVRIAREALAHFNPEANA